MKNNKSFVFIIIGVFCIIIELIGFVLGFGIGLSGGFHSTLSEVAYYLFLFIVPAIFAILNLRKSKNIIANILFIIAIVLSFSSIYMAVKDHINTNIVVKQEENAMQVHKQKCEALAEKFNNPQVITDIIRLQYVGEVALLLQNQGDVEIIPKSQFDFLKKQDNYADLMGKGEAEFNAYFIPIITKMKADLVGKQINIQLTPCEEGGYSQSPNIFEADIYMNGKLLFSN